MKIQTKSKTYTLSPRDLAVMNQAKIGFDEVARVSVKHPGLPPLWSRIPYLMLLKCEQIEEGSFWKEYRRFDLFLKSVDSHYTPQRISKADGGVRELLVPDWYLRKHQRFIQKNILYRIPVSPHACAYHKYRGLRDLAQPHVGNETLIHMDIQDFFSAITEQMVFEALVRETGYPKAVAGFLSRLCCYRHYLPQGACTSPALSNICFKPCDDAIAALAQENGLAYTRYSDDLYLSGNAVEAKKVVDQVSKILAGHGFRIHPRKTRVLSRHQTQKVTAIVVNEKMQVSRQYRRKLRQEIHYFEKFGAGAKDAALAESYIQYLYQLLGKIAFVLYVNPESREFLQAKDRLMDRLNRLRYDWEDEENEENEEP